MNKVDLDWENVVSKARTREAGRRRDASREIRKMERNALSRASSTQERRLIKKTALELNRKATARIDDAVNFDEVKAEGESEGGAAATFTLDVVKDDNTAGTATFNGSGID